MHIAIIFASTEGQTRKICQHVQKKLMARGQATSLISADAALGMDLGDYTACILGASVHAGKYQPEFLTFAQQSSAALRSKPTLFLSVSLAAAGGAHEDWANLNEIVERMSVETGWTPDRTEHVAGAFRYEHYSFVKYWALRWIEAKKDPDAVPGEDKEYTDWQKLDGVLEDWTRDVENVS